MTTVKLDIQSIATPEVAALCRQEQEKAISDDRYCFELFCRALDSNDALAWQAVEAQFSGLIGQWCRQKAAVHGLYDISAEDQADIVHDAWELFIKHIQPHLPISKSFPHIGAVLSFLKKWSHIATFNYKRRYERDIRRQAFIEKQASFDFLTGNSFTDSLEKEQFINCIQELITKHIVDKERIQLIYWRYNLGLKPREIAERYPEKYKSGKEVSNKIEGIRKKLKRVFGLYLSRCL